MATDMILNTFKSDDIDSRKKLFNALNNAASLSANDSWPIMVTAIVIVPGVRAVSKDECENVYLICEDGTAYFSQSNGIAKSAKDLAAIFEFDGKMALPLHVTTQQNARNGNTIKSLEISE